MTDQPDLFQVHKLDGVLTLGLRAGDKPSLILVQSDDRIREDLPNIKPLVEALADAAVVLAEILAAENGPNHAGTIAELYGGQELQVSP